MAAAENEACLKVCAYIAEGDSVREGCRKVDIPIATFFRHLAKSDEANGSLADQYLRARATRADYRFEQLDEVVRDLRSGAIDPAQARVMMDAIKWQTGKEHAKRYGDKLDLNHSGDITVEFK